MTAVHINAVILAFIFKWRQLWVLTCITPMCCLLPQNRPSCSGRCCRCLLVLRSKPGRPSCGDHGPIKETLFGQEPPSDLLGTAPLRNCRWPIPHCHSVLALKWRCVGPQSGPSPAPSLTTSFINATQPASAQSLSHLSQNCDSSGQTRLSPCPTHMPQKNNPPNLLHPTTERNTTPAFITAGGDGVESPGLPLEETWSRLSLGLHSIHTATETWPK